VIWLLLACRNVDADGDGWKASEDCNDLNAEVYPGAPESCDGQDQDCDDLVDEEATDAGMWFADADGDSWGAGDGRADCDGESGEVDQDGDCDDSDPGTFPGADEICDGVDQDCDGDIDEDAIDLTEVYADGDGDGFGAGEAIESCPSDAFVEDATDCDDTEDTIYPGADEVPYDGIDQDCDGTDLDDLDGDGSAWPDDCDDEDPTRGEGFDEICDDAIDNDCDDEIDTDCQYFGGVVSSEPAAVIYGDDESIDCCGSAAGWHLWADADFDQDGYTDILMWSESDGTELKLFQGPFSGELYASDATATLNDQGFAHDALGTAFGDIDGDGHLDLVLAESRSPTGTASVYLGPIEGWFGESDYSAQHDAWYAAELGASVGLADMDGDTALDLILGAPGAGDLDETYRGEVVIADPLDGTPAACTSTAGLQHSGRGDVGRTLSTADVNADGIADLSTPSTHPWNDEWAAKTPALYVAHGPLTTCLETDNVDNSIRFESVYRWDVTPSTLPISLDIRDVDGSGYSDAMVAGTSGASDGSRAIRGFVFDGPVSSAASDDDASAVLISQSDSAARVMMRTAGDLDGDGHVEFVMSLQDNWWEKHSGSTYVLFGPLSGSYVIEEDAFGVLEGSIEPFDFCETDGCEHPGSLFGWSLGAGSDLTGDGIPDIAIGAPGFEYDTSTNDKGPGAVYIYSGG